MSNAAMGQKPRFHVPILAKLTRSMFPSRPLRLCLLLGCLAWMGLMLVPRSWAGLTDFSPGLLRWVGQRFGDVAVERLTIWHNLRDQMASELATNAGKESAKEGSAVWSRSLRRTNGFFNQIPFRSDQELWGVADYWATPVEMLGAYGGDCEDYAIAKYLTLRDLGLPVQKLRITYVRQRNLAETHMVLAYYPEPGADPYILDNQINEIRRGSERTDLVPVFAFNDDDLWSEASGNRVLGGATQVRLWRNLLEKLEKEKRL